MTTLRYILGLTIVGVIGGASPTLAADPDLQTENHDSCIVELTGDVNVSGAITSADIICCVRFIFLQGCDPQPCFGAGDVNCSGVVTSGDVIYLVNYVFKGSIEPCDICTSGLAADLGCTQ